MHLPVFFASHPIHRHFDSRLLVRAEFTFTIMSTLSICIAQGGAVVLSSAEDNTYALDVVIGIDFVGELTAASLRTSLAMSPKTSRR